MPDDNRPFAHLTTAELAELVHWLDRDLRGAVATLPDTKELEEARTLTARARIELRSRRAWERLTDARLLLAARHGGRKP